MGTNAQRLIADIRTQIVQFNIPNAEKYEENVMAFLNQCPDDIILEDAKVMWDNDGDFVISWDTDNLDCIFRVGLKEIGWRIWVGINNHKKDEKCFLEGVGGDEIVYNDFYADEFFEQMQYLICKYLNFRK